jgi:TIR domain
MEERDYFVSYTAADEARARWIVWELEKVHYSCIVQYRDFPPGADFITEMRKAAVACRQTIALFSPAYFRSDFATAEMQAALARDPVGNTRALVPVLVEPCEPGDLLRGRIYIDLVGLDADGARERLQTGIAASRIGIRPIGAAPTETKPKFPGFGERAAAEPQASASPMLPPVEQLRVLFLGAETGSGLDLRGQLRSMQAAVAASAYPQSIRFSPSFEVTPSSLLPTIHEADPHVCHFSGKQDGGNVLLRSDDGGVVVIDDTAFEGLFQALGANVRLVVIDTCKSARCARATTAAVPFTMGVAGDIYDDFAIAFYTDFYRALASGHSLGDAAAQAGAVLAMKKCPVDEIPVLFSRPGIEPRATHLIAIPTEVNTKDRSPRPATSPATVRRRARPSR